MRFLNRLISRVNTACAAALLGLLLSEAAVGALHQVRPTGGRPIAIPNGVMLVPIASDTPPSTSTTAFVRTKANATDSPGARREVLAQLAWVGSEPRDSEVGATRRWAAASYPFAVNATKPTDPQSGAAPCVFVTIPADVALGSTIELHGQSIAVEWFASADENLLVRLRERISKLGLDGAVDAGIARPDPNAPFERFRWKLGVALRGWEEPPPLDGVARLAALQCESLWLAALARIEKISPGTACEVAEQLIATVVDLEHGRQVAAWISDPAELNALLAMMLDTSKSDAEAVESVLTWNRVRAPVLIWTEREDDATITLAFANPTAAELLLPMHWLGAPEPSTAAMLPPGTLERIHVALPEGEEASRAALVPSSEIGSAILEIRCQGEEKRLPFRVRSTSARVPGVALRPFLAPLDLKSVATGSRTAASTELQTEAHLRERLTGWELLLICRDEIGSDPALDRIIVNTGDSGSMTIFATGKVECAGTTAFASTNGVEVERFVGEWRASLQLPAEWIADTGTQRNLRIGIRRAVGERWADAPTASAPWTELPITVLIGLD